MANYNTERRWTTPSKRAASYVEERKAKVHQHGQKEGQPLTDYEAGLRSGYLQCQSDHAGLFRYTQVFPKRKQRSSRVKRERSCRRARAAKRPLNKKEDKELWQTKTILR